jgi:EmrB/QacA subfamily drug resistance transporter
VERRWKVLAVVSVAVFVVGLDMFIVNIAFPKIEEDFSGSSVSGVSWVLNAYAIVLAALMVPAGRIADRIGRRRGFLTGLVVFTLGSALCGAAPSVLTLVLARVIQAAGASLLLPTALALLLPEFAPAERPMAIGIWSAVGGVAAAAGPPIGGLLVHVSWRLVFLVNLPVGVIAFVYAVRLLRETQSDGEASPDLLGGLLLMVAIGLLALGLVKAPVWGWGSAATLASLAGAGVGIALFWWRCLVHPSPIIDPAMLRVRSFALASSASIAFNAAFAAMLLGNVLFLTGVWHYSVLHAGVSLMPGPAMAAITAVTGGRLAGRFGQRRVAAAGITLFAAGGAWWLWHLGATPSYANEMLPGQIMTGTGVGLTLPSLASAAAASLPPARFATGSAVFTMTRQIGFTLGVSILVAVLGSAHTTDPISTFRGGWLFMVIASLLGAALAAAMGPVRQHAAAAAGAPAPARVALSQSPAA